jgi:protein-S-isoprenylcysteine O-methyltransferase Ste14
MDVDLNLLGRLVLYAALLAGAFFVFARVRSDYRAHGNLSRPTAILQVGYFCAYSLSSYAFLDTRLSQVRTGSVLFPMSLTLMAAGLLLVVLSMPFLGRRSFGRETGSLRTHGLYRYSRNPQLVGGFLFIAGYALLWPSWTGLFWAGLWPIIALLMVRGEEEHLEQVFGDEYREYCAQTPRYLGLPRR